MQSFKEFYEEASNWADPKRKDSDKTSEVGKGSVKNKIDFSGGTEVPVVKSDTTMSVRGTQ